MNSNCFCIAAWVVHLSQPFLAIESATTCDFCVCLKMCLSTALKNIQVPFPLAVYTALFSKQWLVIHFGFYFPFPAWNFPKTRRRKKKKGKEQKPGWKVAASKKGGGLPVIRPPVQATIPRLSACNPQQEGERLLQPRFSCVVLWKEAGKHPFWWEWSCWKNLLRSSVAQTLVIMICEIVSLLRILE